MTINFSECVSASWSCSDSGCGNDFVCPSNQIHSKHVTSCEPTCSSLHFLADDGPMDHICTGPSWSGCKCPPGLVLEGDNCIDPDECPCLHNGKMYESGASISRDCNTCICARRNWECSKPGFPGQKDDEMIRSSVEPWQNLIKFKCAATCSAIGDPHYRTFDGQEYTFQGSCSYILANHNEEQFLITAENVACGTSGVTCTKSIFISIGPLVVHLLRGRHVTVNNIGLVTTHDTTPGTTLSTTPIP